MARAQRFAVPLLFALFPCVLGLKGCYFGNDEVPLGSNAKKEEGAEAGADGEHGSSTATGGEGGLAGHGRPDPANRGEPIFVLESTRFAVPEAGGGAHSF